MTSSSFITVELELPNEQSTQKLAEMIARHLTAPLICYLQGDLGVGKTRLVRGIIQTLGYSGNVKSPTYTIVEPYQIGSMAVYHFDLYRLSDPEELDFLGIRDYFDHSSISFIEWPEKGKGWLAPADITIELEFNGLGRNCRLVAASLAGNTLLEKLKQDL